MLVKREVGGEPFQATVFFFQLPELAQFSHTQVCVRLLPGVEGGVTHPEMPTGVPASAYRIAYTICSSEKFDRFMGPLISCETAEAAILL